MPYAAGDVQLLLLFNSYWRGVSVSNCENRLNRYVCPPVHSARVSAAVHDRPCGQHGDCAGHLASAQPPPRGAWKEPPPRPGRVAPHPLRPLAPSGKPQGDFSSCDPPPSGGGPPWVTSRRPRGSAHGRPDAPREAKPTGRMCQGFPLARCSSRVSAGPADEVANPHRRVREQVNGPLHRRRSAAFQHTSTLHNPGATT